MRLGKLRHPPTRDYKRIYRYSVGAFVGRARSGPRSLKRIAAPNFTMSAIGPWRTFHTSLLMSLSGVKRTCRFALQMSAFDPKRTSAPLPMNEFKPLRWSRGRDETTRVHIVGSRECGVAARRARAAAHRDA